MIYYFKSSDGDIIEMSEEVLNFSSVLQLMIKIPANSEDNTPILIELVNTQTFKKIIEWGELLLKNIKMKKRLRTNFINANIEPNIISVIEPITNQTYTNQEPHYLEDWEELFLDIDATSLKNLIMASNYLHIQPLLDTCCKYIASKITGKTPEELREMFDIENDYTPEEEEKIMEEYRYCDDPSF